MAFLRIIEKTFKARATVMYIRPLKHVESNGLWVAITSSEPLASVPAIRTYWMFIKRFVGLKIESEPSTRLATAMVTWAISKTITITAIMRFLFGFCQNIYGYYGAKSCFCFVGHVPSTRTNPSKVGCSLLD